MFVGFKRIIKVDSFGSARLVKFGLGVTAFVLVADRVIQNFDAKNQLLNQEEVKVLTKEEALDTINNFSYFLENSDDENFNMGIKALQEKDFKKAFNYFSASRDNIYSSYNLALIELKVGKGNTNYSNAARYFQTALKQSEKYELSMKETTTTKNEKDINKAIKFYNCLAQIQFILATQYYLGLGVKKDETESERLFGLMNTSLKKETDLRNFHGKVFVDKERLDKKWVGSEGTDVVVVEKINYEIPKSKSEEEFDKPQMEKMCTII